MASIFTPEQLLKIETIYRNARIEYANKAAIIGREVLQGYVPIDTETLQDSIQARVLNDLALVSVPEATLLYKGKRRVNQQIEARYLALILNVPAMRKKEPNKDPRRARSNIYPGTRKGEPTAGWFDSAVEEIKKQLEPIATEIMLRATQEALNEIQNG